MSYVDLATIQDPDTGTVVSAAWGDQVRDNDEFLIDAPWCSVYGSSPQAVPDSTTYSTMTAAAEYWDSDAMHSTVTNPTRITVQEDGGYRARGCLFFDNWVFTGGYRAVRFRVNGTTIYDCVVMPGNDGQRMSVTRHIELTAGDYVEVQGVLSGSGTGINVTLLEFSLKFLGR